MGRGGVVLSGCGVVWCGVLPHADYLWLGFFQVLLYGILGCYG